MAATRLLILLFIFAVSLTAPSAENIRFSLSGATGETYKQFIQSLRAALAANSDKVYNIPVLPAPTSAPSGFISVDLTNYNDETISVGICKANVYVVGFRAGGQSYFLQDIPDGAYESLFSDTEKSTLGYSGSYDSLERVARVTRENLDLGFSEISSAIGNMFYYEEESVPKAFLVIIQTVSEAARLKFIENRVAQSEGAPAFRPDPAFLSLENRWSDLCEQIQIAQTNGGNFERTIKVRTAHNRPYDVNDVNSPVVKNVKLLLRRS